MAQGGDSHLGLWEKGSPAGDRSKWGRDTSLGSMDSYLFTGKRVRQRFCSRVATCVLSHHAERYILLPSERAPLGLWWAPTSVACRKLEQVSCKLWCCAEASILQGSVSQSATDNTLNRVFSLMGNVAGKLESPWVLRKSGKRTSFLLEVCFFKKTCVSSISLDACCTVTNQNPKDIVKIQ